MTYAPAAEVHNYKPENTTRLRASIEAAKNGELREWVVNSDSSATGALVVPPTGFDHLKAWPLFMLTELEDAGVPVAGTGMVRINDNTLLDNRWGAGTGWNRSLKSVAYIGNNLYPARFTPDRSGDRLTIYYRDDGMAAPLEFTISPLGETVTNTMTPAWAQATYAGDFPAGTAVRVKKSSGAQLMLSGACVWNSSGGLMLHNVGQGGSAAHGTGTLNDRWADETGREALGKVYDDPCVGENPPDVLIISLGGNDKRLRVPDTDVLDAIRHRREHYPDSDCLLIAETQLNDTLVPRAMWEAFLSGLYDLADELDVPLIDQDARLGPFKQIAAEGKNADSAGHLKVAVLEDLGRSLGSLLLT